MPTHLCGLCSLSQRRDLIEMNLVGFEDRALLALEGRDCISIDLNRADPLALGLNEVGFLEEHLEGGGFSVLEADLFGPQLFIGSLGAAVSGSDAPEGSVERPDRLADIEDDFLLEAPFVGLGASES